MTYIEEGINAVLKKGDYLQLSAFCRTPRWVDGGGWIGLVILICK